jgi:Restriction endonuclease
MPEKQLGKLAMKELMESSKRIGLGWMLVYIQAKRWKGTVGRPEIQAFAGSLEGH